jgi:GT2 family glycosyltransferase
VIAVVVITHNRVHLLRRCVEDVLDRASRATTEIVIWDNASTDGTGAYLDSLDDPRIRVVHHPENIGQNAYARAFPLTRAEYLVEVDDDVVDAPESWDAMLLEGYRRLPGVGFLAADLTDDVYDEASYARHHVRPHLYTPYEEAGVRLLDGPTGGACAITSRELYERVGGFRQQRGAFFLEDEAYIRDIGRVGLRAAVLADLRVHHAGGSYYAAPAAARLAYWERYFRTQRRKETVKRLLLRVPFVRPLNDRFLWFTPPDPAGT